MADHNNTVVEAGKRMANQANSGIRRGPGNKNLGTHRPQPNPTGMIRALSPGLKGPDKGAGGQ